METLVTKLGLKERSFVTRRARVVVLVLTLGWIFATSLSATVRFVTFHDLVGLVLATGMVLLVVADFLHGSSERFVWLLRIIAVLTGFAAFAMLVVRAASIFGFF